MKVEEMVEKIEAGKPIEFYRSFNRKRIEKLILVAKEAKRYCVERKGALELEKAVADLEEENE